MTSAPQLITTSCTSEERKREFVQVLRLMENFQPEEVHDAVRDAIRLGAVQDRGSTA